MRWDRLLAPMGAWLRDPHAVCRQVRLLPRVLRAGGADA